MGIPFHFIQFKMEIYSLLKAAFSWILAKQKSFSWIIYVFLICLKLEIQWLGKKTITCFNIECQPRILFSLLSMIIVHSLMIGQKIFIY